MRRSKVTGYTCQQSLVVKVNEVNNTKLAAVIDSAVAAGGNDLQARAVGAPPRFSPCLRLPLALALVPWLPAVLAAPRPACCTPQAWRFPNPSRLLLALPQPMRCRCPRW